MTDRFDIFSHLDHKANDESDTEFSFRAFIHSDFTLPNGEKRQITTLFPPFQLRTVESKSDFNRLLNAKLEDLRRNGEPVHKVVVVQNLKPIYDFVP
jgi:hypothetical protein